MTEKIYIGAGKEYEFSNGGTKVTMLFFRDDIKTMQGNLPEEEGAPVRIDICRRREVSEKGMTHYGLLNTFEPKKQDTPEPKAEPVEDDSNDPF